MQRTRVFPGNYKSLAEISSFIEQSIKEAGLDTRDVYAVKLAVDEACCNIIDHAYGGEHKGEMEISVQVETDCLKIELRDQGKPFNPADVPPPQFNATLEELEEHGAGYYLMKKLMDSVHYEYSPQTGNRMILKKRIKN
ncbi:MAG: ATP-binding protein [Anaerolineales bacterium]|nr:ATP-binding protein [Anaerolineales bacterium]